MTYKYAVIFHAIMGGLALIAGTFAAIFKKGRQNHRRAGRLFLIFMGLSALTAIGLTLAKPNPFLLGIGLFTLFLLASGWNWIRRISPDRKIRYAKVIGVSAILASGFLFFEAFTGSQLNIVLIVFGSIMLLMSCIDLFTKIKPDHFARLHGGRMGGAFIASVTAFLVVNEFFGHPLLAWLGPTIIGSPLISLGIRNYYKRTKSKRSKAD